MQADFVIRCRGKDRLAVKSREQGVTYSLTAGVFGSVMNACGSTVISGIKSVLGGSTARCA